MDTRVKPAYDIVIRSDHSSECCDSITALSAR
jgi:hypothetical protein